MSLMMSLLPCLAVYDTLILSRQPAFPSAVSLILIICAESAGGLSENDFIIAAKLNNIPVADLQPKAKPRFWA